ncbi:MAG: hypothetical protein Terrestrivirus3_145 [Terrestrivirus sp.]|uniref:Uncharacterized protein n=1 Tax=Terrestrivirus sp. TaxID=2487775 RepID=A0A3G4ZM07_9VIRU|nr:MAG: hypothetical protein Terrestrivirus3_145 [Terrestrivirus sp.]
MNKKPGILNDLDKVETETNTLGDLTDKPKTKLCKECGKTEGPKPLSDFYSKGAVCRKCTSILTKGAAGNEKQKGDHVCQKCGEKKSADKFYVDSYDLRGVQSYCSDCQKETFKKTMTRYKEANKNKTDDDLPKGIIKCSEKECAGNKTSKDFVKDSTKKSGLQGVCKECKERKLSAKLAVVVDPNTTKKICTGECGKEMLLTEFTKSKTGKHGYANECSKCRSIRRKQISNIKPAEGSKKCSNCNLDKKYSDFFADKSSGDGAQSHCKDCHIIVLNKYQSTYEGHISTLFNDLKHNVKAKSKIVNVEITKDDIHELYKTQNGLCALTGIEMTYDHQKRENEQLEHNINKYNISVDRKNSDAHYTKDNIQLVCAAINRIKYTLTVNQFIEICNKIVSTKNNKENDILPQDEMNKIKNDPILITLIKARMSDLVQNAKSRDLKVLINKDDVIELYIKQNKKCALTNDILSLEKKNNLSLSIDRIDSQKDYTVDNIQLISTLANQMKNDYTNGDFISLCESVIKHHNTKQENKPEQESEQEQEQEQELKKQKTIKVIKKVIVKAKPKSKEPNLSI